jgi:hypothetical protein
MPRTDVWLALLLAVPWAPAQEPPQEKKFFDVKIVKDEIYTYKDLNFAGDFTSFESPAGNIALGRTEAGVTLVIVLGDGSLSIEAPEAAQPKFKEVFGAHPLRAKFTSLYMRLHPKEFEESFGKLSLTKSADEAALKKAQEIYDRKFLSSYHAGPQAILPPPRTRVMDFETVELGQIFNEEGYWLTLRRVSPYGTVYARSFVNPKQK